MLPIGEFMPDQPNYANPGTDVAYNVLPKTAQSYGPMSSAAAYSSNGMGSRCQGALATLDSSGNVSIMAGDATDLWQLSPGSLALVNVSKSAAAYSADSAGRWSFIQWGQDVLASDLNDPIQTFTLSVSAAFADLAGTPPKAKYLAVVKNFVVLGFTEDATDGLQPQRLWWSGINDDTSWPTPGTTAALAVQSDFQDTPGDQGWLQALVPNLGFADCALIFERAIYRMTYVGSPYFFTFAPAQSARGTPAPGSVTQLGPVVYYWNGDGFSAFDGSNSLPIGALKVDNFFLTDSAYAVDQSYLDRISAAVDPISKIVYWAYADTSATNGIPNRILAYHTVLNRWSFIPDQPVEILFRALTIGVTLDGLTALYPILDNVPFSLDSRVWTGGKVVLGSFDSNHKLGFFGAANLAPTVETSETQLYPGRRAVINNSRPIVDGGSPSVSIGSRDLTTAALTYQTATAMNANGECTQRNSARYHRARITLPSGSTFSHIQGVEISARPEGQR